MDVSITTVRSFRIMETASAAASSGRQRNATSALFSISARAAGSRRFSSGSVSSLISFRSRSRSARRRPVVPDFPSMKTLVMLPRSSSPGSGLPGILFIITLPGEMSRGKCNFIHYKRIKMHSWIPAAGKCMIKTGFFTGIKV